MYLFTHIFGCRCWLLLFVTIIGRTTIRSSKSHSHLICQFIYFNYIFSWYFARTLYTIHTCPKQLHSRFIHFPPVYYMLRSKECARARDSFHSTIKQTATDAFLIASCITVTGATTQYNGYVTNWIICFPVSFFLFFFSICCPVRLNSLTMSINEESALRTTLMW